MDKEFLLSPNQRMMNYDAESVEGIKADLREEIIELQLQIAVCLSGIAARSEELGRLT